MPVVMVGSMAFDTIATPFDRREKVIGGACTYGALAANIFDKPHLIGVVGEDFTDSHLDILKSRGIDLLGVKREKGKSFFWEGVYHLDMNTRDTITTELNVFENFNPVMPVEYENIPFLFLANIDPGLQLKVINSMKKLSFSMCDTMNMWIEIKKSELIEVFKKVDCVVLNDSEVRQFTGKSNLLYAAREIRKLGPGYVIIKKGEYGASIVGPDGMYFSIPAYPVEDVIDPTGAGDSFAGAFIGYLAKQGVVNEENIRKALVYGNIVASFTVEGFSIERLLQVNMNKVEERTVELKKMTAF
jgi:sugar/nucleoside kinase (ribokinase family)